MAALETLADVKLLSCSLAAVKHTRRMREHNFDSSAHCQGKIRSADLYLAFGLRLLKPAANIHDHHVHLFEDVEMLRNFCTRSKYFLNNTARISLKASKKRGMAARFSCRYKSSAWLARLVSTASGNRGSLGFSLAFYLLRYQPSADNPGHNPCTRPRNAICIFNWEPRKLPVQLSPQAMATQTSGFPHNPRTFRTPGQISPTLPTPN